MFLKKSDQSTSSESKSLIEKKNKVFGLVEKETDISLDKASKSSLICRILNSRDISNEVLEKILLLIGSILFI